MKKKINLKKIKVSSFVTTIEKDDAVKGKGRFSVNQTPCSAEPEFCNWTRNAWCVSNGHCNTWEAFCTAPK